MLYTYLLTYLLTFKINKWLSEEKHRTVTKWIKARFAQCHRIATVTIVHM